MNIGPSYFSLDKTISNAEKMLNVLELTPVPAVSVFLGTAREYFGYAEIVAGVALAALNIISGYFVKFCLENSQENVAREAILFRHAKTDITSYVANGAANVARGYYVKANAAITLAKVMNRVALAAYDSIGFRVNYKFEIPSPGYEFLLH